MADEVISPPGRVLEFGYQAPNPLDFQRAALAATQPVQEAVASSMASRNQFLLSQAQQQNELSLAKFNAQKQFELAREQHLMQIQREQMRDDRMVKIRQMANQATLDAAKQRGASAVLLQKLNEANSWGAKLPAGDPTDKNYLNQLDSAINNRQEEVKNRVAANLASINLRRQALAAAQSSPGAQALQAQASAFASTPENKALAMSLASQKFATQNPQLADQVSALVAQGANPGDALNKVPGAATAYASLFRAAQGELGDKWLLGNGGKMGAQLAQFNAQSKALDQEEQNVSSFSLNGRRVVWPNLPDAQALANDPNWVKQQPAFQEYFQAAKQLNQTGNGSAATPNVVAPPAAATAAPAAAPANPIMLGVTAGGAAPMPRPVYQPSTADPLAALRSTQGLPAPSGRGSFFLDPNNQIQFRGHLWAGANAVAGVSPSDVSPQDQAWISRVVASRVVAPPQTVATPAAGPAQQPVVPPAQVDGNLLSLVPQTQPVMMPSPVNYSAVEAAIAASQAGADANAQNLQGSADQMANYNNMRFLYNQ